MCGLLFSIATFYQQSETVYMQIEKAVAAATTTKVGVYEGEKAIDFQLESIAGEQQSLKDWRGKTVILNFFASWCHPCQEEMPALVELNNRLDKNDFVIVGVNMLKQERNKEDVLQFLKHYEAQYPIVFDEHGKVMNDYKIIGIPTTFIIDEEGIIKKRINGMVSVDMIESLLN